MNSINPELELYAEKVDLRPSQVLMSLLYPEALVINRV